MPKPIKRRELIRRLKSFGWDGPYQRGPHPFMVQGETRLTIPNPHASDLDWTLVKRIIRQAGITQRDWEASK